MEANEENLAHVAELIEKAKSAGLVGSDWAEKMGLAWCAEAYNGIGPEFMGDRLRDKTSRLLSIFEPAALIHDGRNHVSDGTHASFIYANDEFRCNCHLLADRAYPWWNWKRYRARLVADVLFDFVSADGFGWRAWLEAHERFVARTAPEVAPSYPSNTTKPPEGTCT